MMQDIWLGEFVLSAGSDAQPFWGSNAKQVSIRIVMDAANRAAFEAGIRASVEAGGAKIVTVLNVCLASELPSDRAVQTTVSQIRSGIPTLVEEAVPFSDSTPWEETDWAELEDGTGRLWAVISGVSWPEISNLVTAGNPDHGCCLYSSLEPQTLALAPWLVELREGCDLSETIKARAHEDHALILFRSDAPMAKIRAHLRRFTMMRTPENPDTPVYFRFYDGRVLMDLVKAMSRPFLDGFLTPFSQVAVPLSPLCLIPKGAVMKQGPVTAFDTFESCQGRLMVMDTSGHTSDTMRAVQSINAPDYDALGEQMRQRSCRKLSRELHAEFHAFATQEHCLKIGATAFKDAAAYGLTSVKQVGVFARCQLLSSPDFPSRHPELRRMLTNNSLLAWQKKDRLVVWFSEMLFAPDGPRPLEKTA